VREKKEEQHLFTKLGQNQRPDKLTRAELCESTNVLLDLTGPKVASCIAQQPKAVATRTGTGGLQPTTNEPIKQEGTSQAFFYNRRMEGTTAVMPPDVRAVQVLPWLLMNGRQRWSFVLGIVRGACPCCVSTWEVGTTRLTNTTTHVCTKIRQQAVPI